MVNKSDDSAEHLKRHESKTLLRCITCGSVDDGKYTPIGRLLKDAKLLFDDQPATLDPNPERCSTHSGNVDCTLPEDALAAAPEQGITIDVAYRFFSNDERKFIVADATGHEHSIRKMVTGVSTSNVAVILVDASQDILTQTRRYSFLMSLIGLKQIVLAINRMDQVNFDQATFAAIKKEYRAYADRIGLQEVTAIPLSVLDGDNMLLPSERMPWYTGPTLMAYLETCEVDVSRDDVICAADSPAAVADQFECHIVWMADQPMYVGRPYRLKIGAQLVNMNTTALKHKVNVNTLEHLAATALALNEIAVCNISLDRPVAFEPYATNRELGSFILIDCQTGQPVGAGMINFALRRSQNIHLQHFDIDMAARAAQKQQTPVVLWFTGLSGAGKSTIANKVERQLFAMGRHSYLLDGDNVRRGLSRDLGFTDADRVENIRRVAEVARLMIDSGLIVLTAFISPFRAERIQARQAIGADRFYEIYIDTPLSVAEKRDVKGLYKKARSGQLKNFTGIDSPYEVPATPALTLHTQHVTAEQSAAKVVAFLQQKGLL